MFYYKYSDIIIYLKKYFYQSILIILSPFLDKDKNIILAKFKTRLLCVFYILFFFRKYPTNETLSKNFCLYSLNLFKLINKG